MLDFRLIRFLIVGLANTFVGLLIIFACKWLGGMGDVVSNAIGYGTGMMLGFVLNKHWTFEHEGKYFSAFMRYCAVLACAYLSNLVTVIVAIKLASLNSYLAQALGVIPYAAISFLGSRFFAFHKPSYGAN